MRIFNRVLVLNFLLFVVAGGSLAAAPTEATGLFVGSEDAQAGTQGDPVSGVVTKPRFSAVFNHVDSGATATEARVQFATEDAFTNIVGGSSWQSVTGAFGSRISDVAYNGGALACGTRYWWRIRIKDDQGVIGPWSTEVASFITVECPHEPVVLFVDDEDAQAGTQGDPVASMSHKPSFSAVFTHDSPTAVAAEARVQFATDDLFANIIGGSSWQTVTGSVGGRISDVNYSGGALACGVRYWWRIRIKDDQGVIGPWSTEAASFITVDCPHEPVTLFVGSVEAQSGTQGDPVSGISIQPSFSAIATHTDSNGIVIEGRVQFALDAGFTNILGGSSWQTFSPTTAGNRTPDITFNGSAIPGNTRVYWRIRFRDNAGITGPWSTEAASFETVPAPLPPTSLFIGTTEAQSGTQGNPVQNISLEPRFSAIFNHQDSGATATRLRVQIATDALFENVLHTQTQSASAETPGMRLADVTYSGPALTPGATYHWRARARDQNEVWSPWSTEPASFNVSSGSLEQVSLSVTGLLQGTDVSAEVMKTSGAPFPAGATVEFTSPNIQVLQLSVTGPDTLQVTLRIGNRAPHGTANFVVNDGATAIAQGETHVFHPLQRRASRIGGASQEALNGAMDVGVGVTAAQGEFKYGATDVSISGRKLPLSFGRAYRSYLAYNGATGQSWSSAIDARVRFVGTEQRIEWLNVDGRLSNLFLAAGSQADVGPYVETGRYVEWLRFDGGTPNDEEDDQFVATGPHGNKTTYVFGGRDHLGDALYRLSSHEDRFGNRIEFVRDTAGQLIQIKGDLYLDTEPTRHLLTLHYGDDGRLVQIEDYADYTQDAAHIGATFAGSRSWDFIYSDLGQLVEVRGPATKQHSSDAAGVAGRTRELYAYLAETSAGHHLMHEVFSPVQANLELSTSSGVPWLRNHYDASRRVIAQDVGPSSKTDDTHRRHIKYGAGIVDEVDPLGRRLTATLDGVGRPLQITRHTGTFAINMSGAIELVAAKLRSTDPDTYTAAFEYNSQGEVVRAVLPKGNEKRWHFDDQNSSQRARGRLLRAVMLPGSMDASALPAPQRNGLLVTYEYESVYNLPIEVVPSHAFDLASTFDIATPLSASGQLDRDDSDSFKTTLEYDALGRLIRVVSPAVDASHSPASPNVGQQFISEYTYNSFGQVTSSRDASSYLSGYAGVDADYLYGTDGFDRGYLVTTVSDPTGLAERVEFTYDSIGVVRTVKAPHGAVQTAVVDQVGRLVKSISPPVSSLGGLQYTIEYSWNQDSNLTRQVIYDPVLDAHGSPTSTIQEIVYEWTYGVFGNVVSSTDTVTSQSTRAHQRTYDVAYQLIELHSPGGTKSVSSFDELGRPFKSFHGLAAGSTNPAEAISSVSFDYDLNGNLQRVTDPRGFQRQSSYDVFDRLAMVEDARSPITTQVRFVYAHGGAPSETIVSGNNGSSNRVTLAHHRAWQDNMGRVFRQADAAVTSDLTTPLGYAATETGTNDLPGWSVTTRTLLPDGRPVSMVGDLLDGTTPATSSPAWTIEYDGAGRADRIIDALGNIQRFTYADGRLIEQYNHSVDTGTQEMQISRNAYTYDELSRVISRQACTQDPVHLRYDARGNIVRIDDPASGITRFEYDLASRLTSQTRSASGLWGLSTAPTLSTNNAEVIESRFEYDLDNNLLRTIDNAGNQTTYVYDLAGRPLQTHFANGGRATVGSSHSLTPISGTAAYFETTGGYDAAGNMLQYLDEGGNQYTRLYSPEGELLSMQIAKGPNSLIEGNSSISYDYDGLGRALQIVATQFNSGVHTRTNVWNSLSLLESYTEQINGGTPRQYFRYHDESGRNYLTQSPDSAVTWSRDALGRMKGYTVNRSGKPNIVGAWTYFGAGNVRSSRAISGNDDIEARRDQRGRLTGVVTVSRQNSAQKSPFRYLYDPQTGRMEGMLNESRPVGLDGSSRIGQPSSPTSPGPGRVFGTRTFYDGFGRTTGFASEVTYPQSATDATSWASHPDTQAQAIAFDKVDFPTQTGVFLGQQFMGQSGVGHLETPHTSTYGDPSNPLPQGDGSRFVPSASGDIELEKTSDDELKIAGDGSNRYTYDYQGRVIRTERISDDAVVSERSFDGLGLVYNHEINEYVVVDHDFASPNLSGISISTPDVRFDGGGLRFTGSTDSEFVQFAFPGDIKRNAPGTFQGGLVSHHDFLLDRNTGSSFLCNLYFVDYQKSNTRFRLEIGGTTLRLYLWQSPNTDEVLVAQGTLPGASGPVSIGVRIESSQSFAPTNITVFSGGTARLSHSAANVIFWAPTNIQFEAGANTTRLYRYKGYLDLDFSQADLGVIEYTPEHRILEMLCGSNVPTGTNTPTNLQDNVVAYQMYKDQVIEYLASQGDIDVARARAQLEADMTARQQAGAMGCGMGPTEDMLDIMSRMEEAIQCARAAEACIAYGNALTTEIDGVIQEAESEFAEEPSPSDLGAFLEQVNFWLSGPALDVQPVVMVRAGDTVIVPFAYFLPNPQRVQFSASGPNNSGLPAGLTVTHFDPDNSVSWGNITIEGEIEWTPPMAAGGQEFDIHLRVFVPSISAMSTRPFAEAVCRIKVLPNVVAVPELSVANSSTYIWQRSPFEYAHSQEEFHTTYAGEVYGLWHGATPWSLNSLYLDFAAFSDTDTNFTWDLTGLSGNYSIAPNGDAAEVFWEDPQPGIYNLAVTATNSAGQGVINVRLRVVPYSLAWNIRSEHTSVVTCTWFGQTRQGAVWGSGYGFAGYSHIPYVLLGLDDFVGSMESYISNGDFVYYAGTAQYQLDYFSGGFSYLVASPGPDGPIPALPIGLMSRAAISQQIQGWVQQSRDALEFLNDMISAYGDFGATQLANMQREAHLARMQADLESKWYYEPSMRMVAAWDKVKKPLIFAGTAMARTFILPFEGAFMVGYAAGVYVGWAWHKVFGWLGFDTGDNVDWAEDQLSEMWKGTKEMAHSLGTAEGWSNWSTQMTLAYNADDPHDLGGAFDAGLMFGDQAGTVALIAYGGAKGGKWAGGKLKGRTNGSKSLGAPTPDGRSPGGGFPRDVVPKDIRQLYAERNASVIAKLQLGQDVPVARGARLRPLLKQMSEITAATGKEVGLFRLKSGQRVIRMGDRSGIPGHGTVKAYAHTHPSGNLTLSPLDLRAMKAQGMKRHILVSGDGLAFCRVATR